MEFNLKTLRRNLPLGAHKGHLKSKLNIECQYADFNALLLKQIFVAKEVRFYICELSLSSKMVRIANILQTSGSVTQKNIYGLDRIRTEVLDGTDVNGVSIKFYKIKNTSF